MMHKTNLAAVIRMENVQDEQKTYCPGKTRI